MHLSFLRSLRTAFFSGLLWLIPLGATAWVVNFLLNSVGLPVSTCLFYFIEPTMRSNRWVEVGLSVLSIGVVISIITFIGICSRYFLGRILVDTVEKIVSRLPFVKIIYKTTKQIVETFRKEDQSAFQKVVLIEYPRPGSYAIAFQTSTRECEAHQAVSQALVHVFMPTCPNPTTGFLFLLPKEQVHYLNMSVGDAMKLIISCGAVVPEAQLAKQLSQTTQP